jgi:hypothetical protein
MISAQVVQDHLETILNAPTNAQGDAPLSPAEIAVINAGDDMGLLTIDSRDAHGAPNAITWTRL